MKRIVSTSGVASLIVACSTGPNDHAPADSCDDTPLPVAGKDCAVAGLYSVVETSRCKSSCQSGPRTLDPVDVQVDRGFVTITFNNEDNRTEQVSLMASCTLSGCDCQGPSVHVVFTNTEWFAEGLPETISPQACPGGYFHATRNP